jgi:uncharacterized protein
MYKNTKLTFLKHNKKVYGYLSSFPYPLTFIETNQTTQNLLLRTNNLLNDYKFKKLLKFLKYSGILISENKTFPSILEYRTEAVLWLFITTKCNLRCVYCYGGAGEHRKISLSYINIQTAIDYFFNTLSEKIKLVTLIFHGGGEPTCEFDLLKNTWNLFKLKAQKKKLKCRFQMPSNGVWNKKVLNWILKEKPQMAISIDCIEKVHNKLRPFSDGRGSYKYVIQNLKKLIKNNLNPSVRVTVTKSSLKYLPAFFDEINNIGVKTLKLQPCNYSGRALSTQEGEPEISKFADVFLNLYIKGLGNDINIVSPDLSCLRYSTDYYCCAVEPALGITPEGYLSACPEHSIFEKNISDVFFYGKIQNNKIKINTEKKRFLQTRITDNMKECKNCWLKYNCAGGCLIKSFLKNNDLFRKNTYWCNLSKKINIEFFKMIISNKIFPGNHLIPKYFNMSINDNTEEYIFKAVSFYPPNSNAVWKLRETKFQPLFLEDVSKKKHTDFYINNYE